MIGEIGVMTICLSRALASRRLPATILGGPSFTVFTPFFILIGSHLSNIDER